MLKLICFSLALIYMCSTNAQNFDIAKLNKYIDTLSYNQKFMGSVAVWQNNSFVYNKTVGYSNVTMAYLSTEYTSYRMSDIASIFTTILTLKAVEDGKITMKEPIAKFFPKLQNSANISIEHLIKHTSGITDFTNQQSVSIDKKYNKKQLLQLIEAQRVQPLQEYEYTAANYILLAFILEHVYKKDYIDLVNKFIIKPLELKNTAIVVDYPQKLEALNYHYLGRWLELVADNEALYWGTNTIISTPTDICLFLNSLANASLLKKQTIEDFAVLNDKSILGFVTGNFKTTNTPYWGKFSTKNNALYMHFPKQNTSICIIANGLNYNFYEIAENIVAAIFNEPYKIPELNRPQVFLKDELNQFVGVFNSESGDFKIKIKQENQALLIETEGEPIIKLSSCGFNKFENYLSDLQIEFSLNKDFLILRKGDMATFFHKDFSFSK